MQAHIVELTSAVSQLRDQNMLMRAQAGAGAGSAPSPSPDSEARWQRDSEQKQARILALVSHLPPPRIDGPEANSKMGDLSQRLFNFEKMTIDSRH